MAGRPRGAYQTGGTRAVEEVRRQKAHQQFVGGLSGEERQAYERGGRGGQRYKAVSSVGRVASLGGSTVDSGAGFILGLLAWGWVVLPFLTGGPTAVRNTLRAKFFNRAADGSWLP